LKAKPVEIEDIQEVGEESFVETVEDVQGDVQENETVEEKK